MKHQEMHKFCKSWCLFSLVIRVYYLEVSFMIYTVSVRKRSKDPSKRVNGVYSYQQFSFIHLNQQKGCITIIFSCFYTPKGEIADHTTDQTTQMV